MKDYDKGFVDALTCVAALMANQGERKPTLALTRAGDAALLLATANYVENGQQTPAEVIKAFGEWRG